MFALSWLWAEWGLEPLGLRYLGLRDYLLLEDHWSLDDEELLALVLGTSVAVGWTAAGLDVSDGTLEDFPLVLPFFLFFTVWWLKVETGLSLDDETRSEGQFAGCRLVALITLISTALVGWEWYFCGYESAAFLDEVVYLLVDLLVSLYEFVHQLLLVLLLLHLVVYVILKELFLV